MIEDRVTVGSEEMTRAEFETYQEEHPEAYEAAGRAAAARGEEFITAIDILPPAAQQAGEAEGG